MRKNDFSYNVFDVVENRYVLTNAGVSEVENITGCKYPCKACNNKNPYKKRWRITSDSVRQPKMTDEWKDEFGVEWDWIRKELNPTIK